MSFEYKLAQELSDTEWEQLYHGSYNLKVIREMGGDGGDKPPLQDFYNEQMDRIEAGDLVAWAIRKDDEHLGHIMLVKSSGEWEIGVAIIDDERWGSGVGIRAGLYALGFAFEELGAQQVIAFSYGRDPNTKEQFMRIGFRPLSSFLYMPVEVYDTKWRGKIKGLPSATESDD